MLASWLVVSYKDGPGPNAMLLPTMCSAFCHTQTRLPSESELIEGWLRRLRYANILRSEQSRITICGGSSHEQ
jgi:hypothetical protein